MDWLHSAKVVNMDDVMSSEGLQWSDKCKRLAAVDLTLRAAKILDAGGDLLAFKVATGCAHNILAQDEPEEDYRNGLDWCGMSKSHIDAAVKAILVTQGEIPRRVIVTPLDRYNLSAWAIGAGSAVVDCAKDLARALGNPKATFLQRNRAKVDLERAEAAKVAANAALDAVGRYGSNETPHSDPWKVST